MPSFDGLRRLSARLSRAQQSTFVHRVGAYRRNIAI